MRIKKTVAIIAVAVLAASLFVPAIANAATSAEFNARVYAQNKDLYAFTIDNTHIEYYNPNNAALGVESGSSVLGDKNVIITNTGATPFAARIWVSDPASFTVEGIGQASVPFASDSMDEVFSSGNTYAGGVTGKMSWRWFRPNTETSEVYVTTSALADLGVIDKDQSATFGTLLTAPTHWPIGAKTDYNWAATIVAYTAD